jgi:hypothetical protein
MKLIKFVIFMAVIVGAGYYGVTNYLLPGSATWVHGTWWYANSSGEIITGKDKDGMVFKPNGTVDLVDGSRKPYLSCVYTDVVEGEIGVECKVRGEVKEFVFQVRDNRSKLASTEDPDHGFYVKE